MPTLSEITERHSKRISKITKDRDAGLRDATDARDRDLRALPAAARLYDTFETQIADARDKQSTTDGKAEAVRASALAEVKDALADALADAHEVRREADLAAFAKRRKAEEDAEHEFVLAIGGGAAANPSSSEAQKIRAAKLEQAKKTFDAELIAAQDAFRKSRDAALVAESRGSRDAGRSFSAVTLVSAASMKAARAAAEQALAKSLAALPEAAAEFAEWRQETAAILAEYRRAEAEEFERFHREIQELKG